MTREAAEDLVEELLQAAYEYEQAEVGFSRNKREYLREAREHVISACCGAPAALSWDAIVRERDQLRAALRLHDVIARLDEHSGDYLLWTPQYEEAARATRAALGSGQAGGAREK